MSVALVVAIALGVAACGGATPSPAAAVPAAPKAAAVGPTAALSDHALLAPVAAGETLYAYNGYDDVPAGQACPSPGANELDHCANQLDGLDLVPSNLADLRILAPLPGYVYWIGAGCLNLRTDDHLGLSICHFASFRVALHQSVTRGTVLGLRDPADWWIHLSLDARYDASGTQLPIPAAPAYWPPVPFTSPHTLEGRSLPAASPPANQQYACTTLTSTNQPSGNTALPSPAPAVAPAPPDPCPGAIPTAPAIATAPVNLGPATSEPNSAQLAPPTPTPTHRGVSPTPSPTPRPTQPPTLRPTVTV
jgi:hypothetical protein